MCDHQVCILGGPVLIWVRALLGFLQSQRKPYAVLVDHPVGEMETPDS